MDEVKVPDRVSFQTFPHCSAWNFTADLNDHAPTWVPLQVVVDEFGSRGGAVGPNENSYLLTDVGERSHQKMEWTEAKWEGLAYFDGDFFLCQFHGCFSEGIFLRSLDDRPLAWVGNLVVKVKAEAATKKGTINIHKLPWTASSKINKCYCHFKGKCHFDRSSRNNSVNHFVGSTLFGSLMHVMPRWKQLDSTSQRPQWRRKSAFFLKKTRQPTSLLRKSGATPQICWPSGEATFVGFVPVLPPGCWSCDRCMDRLARKIQCQTSATRHALGESIRSIRSIRCNLRLRDKTGHRYLHVQWQLSREGGLIGGIVTGVLLNNLCFCKTKLLILGKIGRSTVNMYPINISKYYIQSRKKSGIGCTPQKKQKKDTRIILK